MGSYRAAPRPLGLWAWLNTAGAVRFLRWLQPRLSPAVRQVPPHCLRGLLRRHLAAASPIMPGEHQVPAVTSSPGATASPSDLRLTARGMAVVTAPPPVPLTSALGSPGARHLTLAPASRLTSGRPTIARSVLGAPPLPSGSTGAPTHRGDRRLRPGLPDYPRPPPPSGGPTCPARRTRLGRRPRSR